MVEKLTLSWRRAASPGKRYLGILPRGALRVLSPRLCDRRRRATWWNSRAKVLTRIRAASPSSRCVRVGRSRGRAPPLLALSSQPPSWYRDTVDGCRWSPLRKRAPRNREKWNSQPVVNCVLPSSRIDVRVVRVHAIRIAVTRVTAAIHGDHRRAGGKERHALDWLARAAIDHEGRGWRSRIRHLRGLSTFGVRRNSVIWLYPGDVGARAFARNRGTRAPGYLAASQCCWCEPAKSMTDERSSW